MKKYVYVIVSRTLTIPGKVIRKITGNLYSHASFSLDLDLNEMYSFARYHYQNPIVGGFVHENIKNLSLGKDKDVFIKVFKIPVTNRQYRKMEKTIEYFKQNEEKYIYNLFSLIFYPMRISFKIRNSYICTEFVAWLLKESGVKKEKLKSTRLTPAELISILQEYEYYDGSLQSYIQTVEHKEFDNQFFKRENILFVLAKSIRQLGILIFRKIT